MQAQITWSTPATYLNGDPMPVSVIDHFRVETVVNGGAPVLNASTGNSFTLAVNPGDQVTARVALLVNSPTGLLVSPYSAPVVAVIGSAQLPAVPGNVAITSV